MKKVIIGLTLCVFAFVSCTNEDALDIQTTSKATTSNIRSLTEAIQIAENSIKFLGEPTDSRSIGRVVDLENVKYVLNSPSRSAGSNDTLLYVINYADEQGFAVISANMETEGLLAVIEKGNYDATTEHLDENGGFSMFMDMAEQYVATASLGNTPPNRHRNGDKRSL